MRVLQLAPRPILPLDDGGKISIANTSRWLSYFGAELTLFHLRHHDGSQAKSTPYWWEDVNVIQSTQSSSNSLLKIATSIVSNTSLYLERHFNKEICREIDGLCSNQVFDVVHCDHSAMMPLAIYVSNKYKIPIGLRMHNLEYKIWERYATTTNNLIKRVILTQQAKLLKEKEIHFFLKADVCFPISEVDALKAKELQPKGNYLVVGGGVNIDDWVIDSNYDRFELIIATTFHWAPNVEGVDWFCEKVLPKLLESNDKFRYTLIGKNLPERYRNINGVKAIGYVDSVKEYYSKAGIFVVPLFAGSGVRIKILEAMASGLPVVATSIAAEGISASERDGLFIRDTPQSMKECIEQLACNQELNSLREAARRFVEKNHSWKEEIRKIYNAYSDLVKKQIQ